MVQRPTKIDRMPPEVRDWIGRLRDQGRSLDEIVTKLRELDIDALPSRSTVYRHLKKAEEVAEKVRHSRAVAEAVVRRLGDGETDRVTRLNIELMHNAVFEIATRVVDGGPVTLSPQEAMQLAKALDHLGKAAKAGVDKKLP
ncbi:phage protein Gp27 family protein, partial [Rhodoplanes sp. SY1]|uniref:phage protein Gp27 family protein n=1 Tax=Rhodoplanes sp. SY1 TaxID=3166646 RepID=UPI0038B5D862